MLDQLEVDNRVGHAVLQPGRIGRVDSDGRLRRRLFLVGQITPSSASFSTSDLVMPSMLVSSHSLSSP